jgi:TolA-binding protein
MKSLSHALLLATAASGFAAAAAAQADLLTARKIACTAVNSTTCTAPGKCTTEAASAQDKSEVLVIDFAGKIASLRKDGKLEKFADVLEDKVSGDVRSIVMGDATKKDTDTVAASLGKDGKFVLSLDKDGSKAEAACKAES